MSKKESVLVTLYDNLVLRSKVDEALDYGTSYKEIQVLCKSYGLDISIPSISRYSTLRKDAIKNNKDLGKMLDDSQHKALTRIKNKEVSDVSQQAKQNPMPDEDFRKLEKAPVVGDEQPVISTLQLLDLGIQKGYSTLLKVRDVSPKDAVMMAKLKEQITGASNKGFTNEGLQQIRLQLAMMEEANTRIIQKYVPKDKWNDVLNEMEQSRKDINNKIASTNQGRILRQIEKESDLDI